MSGKNQSTSVTGFELPCTHTTALKTLQVAPKKTSILSQQLRTQASLIQAIQTACEENGRLNPIKFGNLILLLDASKHEYRYARGSDDTLEKIINNPDLFKMRSVRRLLIENLKTGFSKKDALDAEISFIEKRQKITQKKAAESFDNLDAELDEDTLSEVSDASSSFEQSIDVPPKHTRQPGLFSSPQQTAATRFSHFCDKLEGSLTTFAESTENDPSAQAQKMVEIGALIDSCKKLHQVLQPSASTNLDTEEEEAQDLYNGFSEKLEQLDPLKELMREAMLDTNKIDKIKTLVTSLLSNNAEASDSKEDTTEDEATTSLSQ